LEQLVGILKKVPELVALRAERLSRELRGNLDSGHGRIFRHVANFVDLNARLACERGLQLFSK
jgi:hypothetical protein